MNVLQHLALALQRDVETGGGEVVEESELSNVPFDIHERTCFHFSRSAIASRRLQKP